MLPRIIACICNGKDIAIHITLSLIIAYLKNKINSLERTLRRAILNSILKGEINDVRKK